MSRNRTLTPATRRRPTGEPQGPPEPPASPLVEQARGFARVARDAVNDCERGEEALRELHRRRNKSGQ